MAVVIVTKHGTTGNPTNLSNGELAVDIAQGRLWVGNLSAPNGRVQIASGTSVENGSNHGELLRWDNTGSVWEADDSLVVADDGSVGIGISNPLRQLHLKGSIPAVRLQDTDGVGSFGELLCSNGSLLLRADHSDQIADTYFRIDIDGSEKLRVTDGGNVGIGYSSPESRLDVNGTVRADGFKAREGTETSPSFSFPSDTNTGMYNAAANHIGFVTAGQERLRIKNGVSTVTNGVADDGIIAGNSSTAAGGTVMRQHVCSQSEYDGLTSKNGNTLYIIV